MPIEYCDKCGDEICEDDSGAVICWTCERLKRYIDYMCKLNLSEMISETVQWESFRKSKTRHFMSRFNHSYGNSPSNELNNPFDVLFLDNYFEEYVVINELPVEFGNLSQYGCTLTDLKKGKYIGFLRNAEKYKVVKTITFKESMLLHIWERPYRLSAQTISDMQYGDRWQGGECVHKGNKYGDTTSFWIIGYFEKKSRKIGG